MTCIGYARAGAADQILELQIAKLEGGGCSSVRSETMSGASCDGPLELDTVPQFLRPGDELFVTRIDRHGARHSGRAQSRCLVPACRGAP